MKVRIDAGPALRALRAIVGASRIVDAARAAAAARAEILLSLALLGGWALVTWGVVLFTSWKVWPLSGGLLLLSCGGLRMLRIIATQGLYSLTRGKPRA